MNVSGDFVAAGVGSPGESGEFGEFVALASEARTKFQRQALLCSPAPTPGDHFRLGGRVGPPVLRYSRNPHTLAENLDDEFRPRGREVSMFPDV
jgi:hypothetical protein